MALLTLSSCANRGNKNGIQMVEKTDDDEEPALQQMEPSEARDEITYKGQKFISSVVRVPDESLPSVQNGQGERFKDNRITVDIMCGGRQVLRRVFTKQDFAPYVEPAFLEHSILEGLVYDASAAGLSYLASVGYPQTDLYTLLRLTVSADGKYSIEKTELVEEY